MKLPHEYVEPATKAADYGSLAVSILAAMQWVPHASAIVALIWLCLRAYLAIEEIRLKRAERKQIERAMKGD
jgi:hypothetical protein